MHAQPTYEELIKRVRDLEKTESDHQHIKKEQLIILEVLELINETESFEDLIRTILNRLKHWSGCEAVGIRLKEGPDFPYFVTSGFPDKFVEMEKHLCSYDKNGKIKRDAKGNPILECMCGNILRGRVDPSKNFFTEDGSFWSNCTTKLLATTTDADRQSRTRNRCNSEGYESVALIPLRSAGKTFGLIQFNDHRKERFSPELIALFRRVADYIASSLSKRQAQKALQKSEMLLRTLINTIPDLVWLKDLNGVYLSCNSRFERFVGAKEAEIIGKTDYDFVDKELANFFRENDKTAIAAGKPYMNEEEITFADDGHREILETIKAPLYDPEGKIAGVLGIAHDITRRKQTEAALRKSESDLKNAQHLSGIGSWEWDVQNDRHHWSEKIYHIYGRDPKLPPAVYPEVQKYFTPESWRHLADAVEKALADGVAYQCDAEVVLPDGQHRWITARGEAVRDTSGNVIMLRGTVQDITENKKAETKLAASERKYRALFEGTKEGILVAEVQSQKLLYANPAICSMLGYTNEELCQMGVADIHPKDKLKELLKLFELLVSGKEIEGEGLPFLCKNKSIINLNVNAAPVDIDELPCLVGFFTDVTDRIKLEKEKNALEVQLNQVQKMESVGRLAGGVAHDLNNLLSPILGYSDFLLEDLGPNDNRRDSVNEIHSAGIRARNLVRQLLAFSRKQTLEFKPININDTVRGFENLLRRTIPKDIEIKMILSQDTHAVMTDVGQIEQVLMNLAVNSADAMRNGGSLTIETSLINLDDTYSQTRIDVTPGSYFMLAISDTGHGMDEETCKQIFEPFFSTKGERGTGLGLATVYGIVKQHGGNIYVYSEPGNGTTFKIYLPVIDKAPVKEKTDEKAGADLKGSETILLVEDNESVRKLAGAILKKWGYRVISAESSDEAMRALASHEAPLHLLLTDVVMPGLNGKELYEKIAKQYPGLKVLFMSGYTDNVIAHRGVLEEGVRFIQKPFSNRILAAKVREVLDEP